MSRRFISLITVLVIAFNFTAFAESSQDTQAVDERIVRMSNILSSIGIMDYADAETTDFDAPVTRAEYADMIARLLKLDISGSSASRFTDVPEGYWANPSINALVDRGIIAGFSTGTFRPEETITYEQAIKIIVSALGYQNAADYMGGYPDGYLQIASRYDLLKNVAYKIGEEISFAEVTALLYNSLEVPIMTYTIEEENWTTGSDADRTILSEYHDVYYAEGVLQGNDITQLASDYKMPEGQVQIGNVAYHAGELDVYDELGYLVSFYYREDEAHDERTLLYLERNENKSQSITIRAEDIENYQDRTYSYIVGTRLKTAELSVKADIVYNYKAYMAYDKMCPESGYVTLIDNDKNGVYDVAKIYEQTTCVVFNNNTEEGVISDRYAPENAFRYRSEDEDIKAVMVDTQGNAIEPEGAQKNDVLTLYKSVDGEFVYAILCRETVEGQVESVRYDDAVLANCSISVAGQPYKITAEFLRYEGKLSLTTGGIFYLDAQGAIAAIDKTYNAYTNFGYLTRVIQDEADPERLLFKIFTSEDEFQTYTCSQKMRIDGRNGMRADAVLTVFTTGDPENRETIPQLITYELNSDGELYMVDTTAPNLGGGTSSDKDTLKEIFSGSVPVAFKAESQTFGLKFCYTDSTIMFNIPDMSQPYTNEDFSIITPSNLVSDTEYSGVKAYSIYEDALTADAIVMSGASEKPVSGDTKLTIVTDVKITIDEDEQETYEITGNTEGQEVKFLVSYEHKDKFDNLKNAPEGAPKQAIKPGDVIRYGVDGNGQASAVSYVYDGQNQEYQLAYKSYLNDFFRAYYGTVTVKDDGYIKVSDGEHEEVYRLSGASVLVCEITDRAVTVRAGSAADIEDAKRVGSTASKVLIRNRYMVPQSIIIFK